MPRPSKYSPEAFQAICDKIAAGVPDEHAARAGGVSSGTFRRWLRDRPELRDAVRAARSRAVERHVGRIEAASSATWTASAWWLERQYPELFGSDRRQMKELLRTQRELAKAIDEFSLKLAEIERQAADRRTAADARDRPAGSAT